MSPASKSKSKDKKAGKELKSSSKSAVILNPDPVMPPSGYNQFSSLDMSSTSSLPSLHANGRLRNFNESDDYSGSTHGSGADYDSASNQDSRSVESEEHNKDKSSSSMTRQEVIPGADNEKREKIRQKNERKHQRQKERRAQELHERCSGYLMSRKLEVLAQQLVGMGFPAERATMALILNEGKVEAAVAWLFEDGEDADKHDKDENMDTGGNLKIDISDELARIAELETRFKCSKQDVERVVVSCEGDLDRAEEVLQSQKLDPPSSSVLPKAEEASNLPPPTLNNNSNNGKVSVAMNQTSVRQQQSKPSQTMNIQQPRKDDREFNYTKSAVGLVPKVVSKSTQPLPRVQPKLEWARPQPQQVSGTVPTTEKRWLSGGSTVNPSVASYPAASSQQVSPTPVQSESRSTSVGSAGEFKSFNQGMVREPVVVMQRPPQYVNANNSNLVTPVSSISLPTPGVAHGWYPSNSEIMMKTNGLLSQIPTNSRGGLSTSNMSSSQFFPLAHYQQQHQHHQQLQQLVPGLGTSHHVELPGSSRTTVANSTARCRGGPSSSTLAVASSLGLFSGVGSTTCSSGSTSPVDWHTGGSMSNCDYNNIDWSLDRSTYMAPSMGIGKQQLRTTNGFWPGMNSLSSSLPKSSSNGHHMYEANASMMGIKQAMRPSSSSGGGVSLAGLQDGPANGDGSSEWTSPFEGKDLFSLPRQFVSSPSL